MYNVKDLNKLRKLFDDVDTHFKALSVLGVESENYSMAIMPDLMKKLPHETTNGQGLFACLPVCFERKVLDTVHGDKVHRCAIYNLEVKDLKGVLQCATEAATLSKLTSVRNVRPKILKERYQHLKDLEFLDVSDEEELNVHVILELEDLRKLRTGKMVWEEPGEPVAEQTKLG